MAEEKEISLTELLSGGNLATKLLGILPDLLSQDKKQKLLEQLATGKPVIEFHTKAGFKNDAPQNFEKRTCLTGHMTLPSTGEWTCFALWMSGNDLFQGTFRLKIDPDPAKTVLSLQMSSPPGTIASTYTPIGLYFKIDTDGSGTGVTIAGELGVSYRDKTDQIRTIKFTTEKDKVFGL